MNDNDHMTGELLLLPRKAPLHVDATIIVQLLSIRDHHPQWREFEREDGIIAAHKYAAQLNFSAPHKSSIDI